MGVDTKGLIDGYLIWEEVADAIQRTYDLEELPVMHSTYTPSYVKLTFPQKSKPGRRDDNRSMSVFLDGYCSGDYPEVTSQPCTLVSLGWGGDSEEIIGSLVGELGGWFMAQDSDGEWVRMDAKGQRALVQQRMERREERMRAYEEGALF